MILSVFLNFKKSTHRLYEVIRRKDIIKFTSDFVSAYSVDGFLVQSVREGIFLSLSLCLSLLTSVFVDILSRSVCLCLFR